MSDSNFTDADPWGIPLEEATEATDPIADSDPDDQAGDQGEAESRDGQEFDDGSNDPLPASTELDVGVAEPDKIESDPESPDEQVVASAAFGAELDDDEPLFPGTDGEFEAEAAVEEIIADQSDFPAAVDTQEVADEGFGSFAAPTEPPIDPEPSDIGDPGPVDEPLGSLIETAMSAGTTPTEPDLDAASDEEPPPSPKRSGFGLSRMLAAAQSVFGEGEDSEEAPVVVDEDLPEELPSWAVTTDRVPTDEVFASLGGISAEIEPTQDVEPADEGPSEVEERADDPVLAEPVPPAEGDATDEFVAQPDIAEDPVSPFSDFADLAAEIPAADDSNPEDATHEDADIAEALAMLGESDDPAAADVEQIETQIQDAEAPAGTDSAASDPSALEEIEPEMAVTPSDHLSEVEQNVGMEEVQAGESADLDEHVIASDDSGDREPEEESSSPFDLSASSPMIEFDRSADRSADPVSSESVSSESMVDEPIEPIDPDDADAMSDDPATSDPAIPEHEVLASPEPDLVDVDSPLDDEPERTEESTEAELVAAEVSEPGDGATLDDPWGDLDEPEPEQAAGIDVPVSTLPVPSVYQELEDLPPTPEADESTFALADTTHGDVKWGEHWEESAQGWIETPDGSLAWRPIVSTSSTLPGWAIETYLGVVAGDASLPVALDADLDTARAAALDHALGQAMSRGAHALTGLQFSLQRIGEGMVVTASATAVTLRSS